MNLKLSFFLVFLLLSSLAIAHLDGGTDKIVNGNLVDFGYSPEKPIEKEPVTLSLSILDPKTKNLVTIENIWVRISRGEEVLFSAILQAEEDQVAFTHTFPEKGVYEIK